MKEVKTFNFAKDFKKEEVETILNILPKDFLVLVQKHLLCN